MRTGCASPATMPRTATWSANRDTAGSRRACKKGVRGGPPTPRGGWREGTLFQPVRRRAGRESLARTAVVRSRLLMTSASPGQAMPAGSATAAPGPSAPRLARSAGVIGVATMTSRVLGLVRDQVMAYLFGAGNAVDAYNVAFRIPNLVRDLFAEGAMSAAFVPTFTRYLTREGRPAAWRLGNHVVNALLMVTAVLVCAGLIFTQPLVTM